ncbi:FeS cluster assembly protein SufD [Thermoanaerobacter kivui]|uniref:FeS cluster assembly protein SufD n=1 Tax=Thermoanaerobacter kivui TaxID=2325 RepID=A0A097AUI9_THEKI|nr:Fe-S cluster assembly protein SufD [Thermoanaerobacter kivui]AIS53502.1 FeS cluster assembly protein SufD [Thermoanaerobacter kivui]
MSNLLDEKVQSLFEKEDEIAKEYRRKAYDAFSSLPFPKWKRVNIDKIELPFYKEYNLVVLRDSSQETVKITDITKSLGNLESKTLSLVDRAFGVDDKFVNMAKAFYNSGFYIKSPTDTKTEKPIVIDFIGDERNDTIIDYNIIEAEANSNITIVFDYNSGLKGFHNGITAVIANEGSTVNIVKIQRLGDDFNDFDNNIVFVGKDATVNWSNVVIGSKISAFDVTVYLDEIGGTFNSKSIFLGVDSQKYDMSYKVFHQAPKTTSSVDLKGALKGSAKAVFRGNIDIKKGAKKAKADENETVLLLDKTVKSDAIPALYCGEDDVQANHSASAGQIDENKLYYVMSRGFSLEEAKLLMVQAVLNPVIDLIPYDPVREIIIKGHIGRRILR